MLRDCPSCQDVQIKARNGNGSFWHLANHLGQRFREGARRHLGPLESAGESIWRCGLLGRLLFLVSSAELPVEPDRLPLHILAKEQQAKKREKAEWLLAQAALWQQYADTLGRFPGLA